MPERREQGRRGERLVKDWDKLLVTENYFFVPVSPHGPFAHQLFYLGKKELSRSSETRSTQVPARANAASHCVPGPYHQPAEVLLSALPVLKTGSAGYGLDLTELFHCAEVACCAKKKKSLYYCFSIINGFLKTSSKLLFRKTINGKWIIPSYYDLPSNPEIVEDIKSRWKQ